MNDWIRLGGGVQARTRRGVLLLFRGSCRALLLSPHQHLHALRLRVNDSTALLLSQEQLAHLPLQLLEFRGDVKIRCCLHIDWWRCRAQQFHVAVDWLATHGAQSLKLLDAVLLPLRQLLLLLVVVTLGSGRVGGQAVRVEVMITLGLGELVAVAKPIEADGALARWQVALGQVFANQLWKIKGNVNKYSFNLKNYCYFIYLDQLEHDWLTEEIVTLELRLGLYQLDGGLVQTTRTLQTDLWRNVRVTWWQVNDEGNANVLRTRVLASRWKDNCLDALGTSPTK